MISHELSGDRDVKVLLTGEIPVEFPGSLPSVPLVNDRLG